jgi:hypothetical protein
VKFAQVLPYLEAGRRVRRAGYGKCSLRKADVGERFWCDYCNTEQLVSTAAILASDWEVVEEPAPAKPTAVPACSSCGEHPSAVETPPNPTGEWTNGVCCNHYCRRPSRAREVIALRESVARLTRELREANDYAVDFKATVERLTRERDEARAELADERKPWTLTHDPGGWSWSRK